MQSRMWKKYPICVLIRSIVCFLFTFCFISDFNTFLCTFFSSRLVVSHNLALYPIIARGFETFFSSALGMIIGLLCVPLFYDRADELGRGDLLHCRQLRQFFGIFGLRGIFKTLSFQINNFCTILIFLKMFEMKFHLFSVNRIISVIFLVVFSSIHTSTFSFSLMKFLFFNHSWKWNWNFIFDTNLF